jgi:5-methylcytosine-specific restriction endonuclease McrA
MPYKDPEKDRQCKKEFYEKNKKEILERIKKRYHQNLERFRIASAIYYEKNKQRDRQRRLDYGKKYQKENKGKVNAKTAKRRARVKAAISDGSDLKKIKMFYLLAEELTKRTGKKYVVDHKFPISKGGLHHQDNLQVITADENLRKFTKLDYMVKESFVPNLCQKN